MIMTNALACYELAIITAIESFIVQAPDVKVRKLFFFFVANDPNK
jgi:hypothetical protein